MNKLKVLFLIFYFGFYIFILTLSMAVFYVFRPYSYVDNCSSYINCTNKNVKYPLGPSFVYCFGDKLDSYNSKKSRKLCEYGIMWDYQDTYKVNNKTNYRLNLIYQQESSWINAFLISSLTFIIGVIIIETFKTVLLKLVFKKIDPNDEYFFGQDILKILRYLID